jgi:hypothetical protein
MKPREHGPHDLLVIFPSFHSLSVFFNTNPNNETSVLHAIHPEISLPGPLIPKTHLQKLNINQTQKPPTFTLSEIADRFLDDPESNETSEMKTHLRKIESKARSQPTLPDDQSDEFSF